MNSQQKMHYKETSPIETVNRLKELLKELNIEMEEEWIPKSSADTYSLRIRIKGTKLGSNGKGVTKEFAMASAYAEFFERFQNNWLGRINIRWKNNFPFYFTVDEKKMSIQDLVESNNAFMNMYFSSRGMADASSSEKAEIFRRTQKIDYTYHGEKDVYITIPFYSVKNKRVEYLPYNTYSVYYGSNGMCGGNSPEEALVQGLSEIIERHVQKKLFLEKPSLPDIPEKYIAKFPYIAEIFKKLKLKSGYTFLFKDCSFAGKYPVAALVVIQKNTGRYGIKLGCHPDYGLAMERAITEAAQGNDIIEYANRSYLDFKNEKVDNEINIYNCFKTGTAQFPYELLSSPSSYPFIPVKDVSAMSNREILNYMMNDILNDGYDILVRDVSYLGFPSYHIIVPGMSEMLNMTDTRFQAYHTRFHVVELLNNPELITKENCKYVIGVLDFFGNIHLENTMSSYYGVLINFQLPGEDVGMGWIYLSVMCNILKEDYKSALGRMALFIRGIRNVNEDRKNFYNAVYYYLSAMVSIRNHSKVIEYLRLFLDEQLCRKIDDLFINPTEVIIKQYPKHEYSNREKCRENHCCDYYKFADYVDKLKEIQMRSPVNQERLSKIFG